MQLNTFRAGFFNVRWFMRSFMSRLFLGVFALTLVTMLSGCERHSKSETYYLVVVNSKLPYWQSAAAGLDKAAALYGVTAEMRGTDTFDPQGEVKEFRDVVARKPAGILVSVADPALMAPEIDAAVQAGIPVITMDSDAPASHRLYFIGTNNLQAGRLGGERVVHQLNGKGNVVFFTMPGQPNLDERLKGYQDVFSTHPGVNVVEVFNIKGDSGTALDKTTEYLARTGASKIDAFVCLEASAGKDVAEALKRANAKDRELVAMDVDEQTLNLVNAGLIDATVAQKPYTMAFYGLKQLDDLHHYPLKTMLTAYSVDSFSPVPSFVDTGTTLVDKGNVDIFLKSRADAQAP
jgi:ribose transport system substrate-binding protein